jgi:lipopolysaccharide export system protein LptA
MSRWQRNARLLVAVFGVLFAAFVARQLKPRDTPLASMSVHKVDPGAVVETTGGMLAKHKGSREDVSVKFEKQLVYPNGTSKLMGVTIVTDERNGTRTFTISGKEGRVGNNDSSIALDGEVRLQGSDGMTAATEHATYSDSDGVVRAPGPVAFARGRMRGTGVGMTWDKAKDVLAILEQAVVHVAPDDKGAGAAEIMSGAVAFARRDKFIRFEKFVHIQRGGQTIEANTAVLYLSEDEKRIDTLELHEQTRVATPKAAPGALQSLTGETMNLKYADDGESLQHALVAGNAAIEVAGEAGKAGRQIAAKTIDITLAADGSTPISLIGREAVQLTFPPEAGQGGRTIRSTSLDARGEPGKGLTHAQFSGNVQFREQAGDTGRAANSATLDVGLKPGLSTIEDAKFTRGVRFEQGTMSALAALAHYDPDKGTLALSGSEPGAVVPHVVNDKIVVDAAAIDVTLDGPKVKAAGNVRSVLKPPPKPKPGQTADSKLPSMLKQEQEVTVLGEKLDYDGTTSKGTYTGAARLFQSDTSIKGDTIVIDNKAGNLTASGGVTTTTVLEQTTGKEKKKERQHSIATAKDLKYDDAERRLTYTGDAHMTGPEGDMTAARIELYLKPSGDELERAEAYENLTLREQSRETKGAKMIYTTADEIYVITGAPVKIVDQCQRETVGRTLTFNKGTDSIVVDGNSQIRTQTKGGNGKCS